jgi:hypothetical protein
MSRLIAAIARLFARGARSPAGGEGRRPAPVTLRDPAWLVRSSGWAPVWAGRGAEHG